MALEYSDDSDNEAIILLEPATLDDMEGLAEIIGAFLAAMRREVPATDEPQQAAFARLEQLRARLSDKKKGALLMEDIFSLDTALMLFSMFLFLKFPRSERRETAINSLWKIRGQLSVLRRSSPPGMN